jgi:hypothetical protein
MSVDPTEAPRFTLRDLPLPAKVVITCFLLSVGLGYTAALVQLHFQDSKSGSAMPTVDDVVLKFTGKKKFSEPPPPPVSQFVKLITAPEEGPPFNGTGTMSPAFFSQNPDYNRVGRTSPADQPHARAELTGERDVLVLWANAPADAREKAYRDDHFNVNGNMPKAITQKFVADGAVKVKSIIDARCARCHGKGEPQEHWSLQTYDEIKEYLKVPDPVPFTRGDYIKVEEPISLDKLTQSTHAHLLSFAVLFSCTGLIFAFTSYPTIVRCVLGPWVLLAIVTDVAFWWLARLSDDYGVYFAKGVIGTGLCAGAGLGAQITLSLWNMYGPKGKIVLLLLFAIGAAAFGLVGWKVVWPHLQKKQEAIAMAKNHIQPDATNGTTGKKDNQQPVVVETPLSQASRMLTLPLGPDGKPIPFGAGVPWADLKFKKEQTGGMVRAFFDKEKDFTTAIKDKDTEALNKLTPERHGERAALLAWTKLPEAERKKAYDADVFELPADLAGKPITKDYLAGNKLKVKTMFTDRCIRCHEDEDKAKFEDYEQFRKYLELPPK